MRLRLFRQFDRRAMFSVGTLALACALGLGSVTIPQPQVSPQKVVAIRVEQKTGLVQASAAREIDAAKPEVRAPVALSDAADKSTPTTQLSQEGPDDPAPDSVAVPDQAVGKPVQSGDQASVAAAVAPAATMKAVVIVGPTGTEMSSNLAYAEEFAGLAESYGMDVRRVFHPHATWANVLANIQGANIVAYFGHGNGWPSPYGPAQQRTKDGFGLDARDGGSAVDVRYYGANWIRKDVVLAPNAIVVLSHLCYASGNSEPGMPIPGWETAWQRVDNYASGFLSVGARAVFAYGTGSINPILDGLFTTDQTMDEIFMTGGAHRQPYYGFTGWDDRYFDSARTSGLRNHLDPGASEGFLRAISGELTMTTQQWLSASTAGLPVPNAGLPPAR